jgi:transposase InsO family protein
MHDAGPGCAGDDDDLGIATCFWVSWFNEARLHSELDDRTPAEVEADYGLRHGSQPDGA